ncbi:hypothetical protein JCM11251_005485 [Rhodosporidiobolus azoricus]
MVYYVCPNCGHRSNEYGESMVHYNACDVVRVRNVSSPTGSTLTGVGAGGGGSAGGISSTTASSGTTSAGGQAGAGAGGQGTGGEEGGKEEVTRTGQAGVLSQRLDPAPPKNGNQQ